MGWSFFNHKIITEILYITCYGQRSGAGLYVTGSQIGEHHQASPVGNCEKKEHCVQTHTRTHTHTQANAASYILNAIYWIHRTRCTFLTKEKTFSPGSSAEEFDKQALYLWHTFEEAESFAQIEGY